MARHTYCWGRILVSVWLAHLLELIVTDGRVFVLILGGSQGDVKCSKAYAVGKFVLVKNEPLELLRLETGD